MPKKKSKRKRSNGAKKTQKTVTPYVAERIAELAPEYGWDAKEVADLIAGGTEPKAKKGA